MSVAGQAILSGAEHSNSPSGIVANTNAAHGGDAGAVTLTAGSLQVLSGAEITSQTFGSGNGGKVTVNVTGQALVSGVDFLNRPSGILADSNASGIGGNAGSVTLTAGSLQVLGGAQIGSETLGLGPGGDVNVSVSGQTLISGAGPQATPSGIVANSRATGPARNAGPITLNTTSLQVLGGAQISSQTFGSGKGGDVIVNVSGQALFSGAASGTNSGITTDSNSGGSGGNAGPITLNAGTLQVLGGALISSRTSGSGSGGAVTVNVSGPALLSGTGPFNVPSGITTDSNATGTGGPAGLITLNSATLKVLAGAQIGSDTFGSGAGGDVKVAVSGQAMVFGAGSINPSGIFASSNANTQGGSAGSVTVDAGSLRLDRGVLEVEAVMANGGDLTVRGENVTLSRGQLIANSARQGGNIDVLVGNRLLLLGAMVSAKAGGNGGAINLAAPISVLQNSTINGLSGGTPVTVRIHGDLIIDNSKILTDTPQVFPTVDLTGSLVALPKVFPATSRPLPDVCGVRLGGELSSFVVTGKGGLPPGPGGWLPDASDRIGPPDGPDWTLSLRPAQPRRNRK